MSAPPGQGAVEGEFVTNIPAATPRAQLAVIAACWGDCLEEGAAAITRATRTLLDVATTLDRVSWGDGARLRGQVRAWERGEMTANQLGSWLDAAAEGGGGMTTILAMDGR